MNSSALSAMNGDLRNSILAVMLIISIVAAVFVFGSLIVMRRRPPDKDKSKRP